jgi:hypothetical protein
MGNTESRPGRLGVRRRIVGIAAVLVALTVVAGCTDSGFNYVKSSEDRTYFKVPDRWTLFDEKEMLTALGGELTAAERRTELTDTWRVAFDAAPRPSLRHLGAPDAEHPVGLAVVRTLDFDASDKVSLSTLRNYFFDVDQALEAGTADVLEYEEIQREGGFRGSHMVATIEVDGTRMTIDQTILLDQATRKLYGLLVSCSVGCFDENRGKIRTVVDSWTVREK